MHRGLKVTRENGGRGKKGKRGRRICFSLPTKILVNTSFLSLVVTETVGSR